MGVAADLDYQFRSANAVQRALQALAATRGGAWVFARALPPPDTWVERLTHARHTVPGLLVGLPVVDLTTTGRRSGLPRTTHLIAIPHRDTLALLGTNFGQRSTPASVLNLEAQRRVAVTYRGTTLDVVARPADEAEQAEVLARSEEHCIGYRRHQSRITGRRLRVLVLLRAPA